jgi:CAAX protease family protein
MTQQQTKPIACARWKRQATGWGEIGLVSRLDGRYERKPMRAAVVQVGHRSTMVNIESLETIRPKPWGIVATVLWALLALLFSGIASGLALVLRTGEGELGRQDLMNDGPVVLLMVLILAAVQIPVLIWAAQSRGWRAAEYLGWVVPKLRDVAVTLAIIVVLALGSGALDNYLSGHNPPVPPPFQIDTYRSAREAGTLGMLWIAFVVAAPLSEELLFRGFLYRGWARSPLAVVPAVVVFSALWAIAHVQCDWCVRPAGSQVTVSAGMQMCRRLARLRCLLRYSSARSSLGMASFRTRRGLQLFD